MKRFGISTFIILMGAVSLVGQVRTFVSVTGVDNAECSRTNPCRTFGAAVTVVANAGEVVALDTGGYGPFTVDKSVTIHAPAGIIAAIAPTSGPAITVFAPVPLETPRAKVVLRNLYLNSQGGSRGVYLVEAAVLHIENLVVNGFSDSGIFAQEGTDFDLFVKDSILRDNLDGIFVEATAGTARASIDHVRAENNERFGFFAGTNSRVQVSNSLASGHREFVTAAGFQAGNTNGKMSVHNCVSTGNNNGVVSNNATATMIVSNTRVSGNTTGVQDNAGTMATHQNNSISDNTTTDNFDTLLGQQ